MVDIGQYPSLSLLDVHASIRQDRKPFADHLGHAAWRDAQPIRESLLCQLRRRLVCQVEVRQHLGSVRSKLS